MQISENDLGHVCSMFELKIMLFYAFCYVVHMIQWISSSSKALAFFFFLPPTSLDTTLFGRIEHLIAKNNIRGIHYWFFNIFKIDQIAR